MHYSPPHNILRDKRLVVNRTSRLLWSMDLLLHGNHAHQLSSLRSPWHSAGYHPIYRHIIAQK